MNWKKVYGTKEYLYLEENTLQGRHKVYIDSTGEYIIKMINVNEYETKSKIEGLINFKKEFDIKNPNYSYLTKAFPIESVYSSKEKSENDWMGFVMKQCQDESLYEISIPDEFYNYFNSTKFVKLLDICISLCNCFQILHYKEIWLSDIKLDNFFVTRNAQVYPIDVDGVSFNGSLSQPPLTYYCIDKEKHDSSDYIQTPENETYGLTVLLLQLLTGINYNIDKLREYDLLGYSIFTDMKPNMNKVEELFYKRWFLIPESIREIFLKVIYNNCYILPTAYGWYHILSEYKRSLEMNHNNVEMIPQEIPKYKPKNNPKDYFGINVNGMERLRVLNKKSSDKNYIEERRKYKEELEKSQILCAKQKEELDAASELIKKIENEKIELNKKIGSYEFFIGKEILSVKRRNKVFITLLFVESVFLYICLYCMFIL